jgi:type VI secretion system secreted protein VgrG
MSDLTQDDRLMQFTSPLGKDVLLIEGLTGSEGISHLFEFRADLLADKDTSIDPKDIVGTNVTVAIALTDDTGTRWINGIVTSFEQGAGDGEFNEYYATIMPSMWELTLSSTSRVFQSMSVLDIVKKIFTDYGLSVSDKTVGTFLKLEYCTQYSESDFHFVSRLLQQHGINYWFEHSDSDNKIILGNDTTAYQDCPIVSTVQFEASKSGSEGAYGSRVTEFIMEASMVSGSHSTSDYNYSQYKRLDAGPTKSASTYGKNSYEVYLYSAGQEGYLKELQTMSNPDDSVNLEKVFLQARFQASESVITTYRGNGSLRTMLPGYTFTLSEHPSLDGAYLIVGATHSVDQLPSYRTRGSSGDEYSNRFMAVQSSVIYKPPQTFEKPRIYGPQTAKVVVSSGEEIHLDKMGRVNVQFFWDKVRKDNTPDNTWVRVAQQWAGNGWGAYFWPRVGDEVVVEFLNGDPDNPLVVGSVYNGTNVPKYALPDMSTRSGWVTRSSKSGSASNANELRFEDKKGSEQIFINAEKDMDHRVENDHRVFVGGKESLMVTGNQLEQIGQDHNINVKGNRVENVGSNEDITIGSNRTEKVGGNESLNIGGSRSEKTGGDDSQSIGGNLNEKVGGNSSHNISGSNAVQVGGSYSMTVTGAAYVQSGATLVIQAADGITLSGPGGFITISDAGISISGTMVLINSGGMAIPGMAGPLTPPTAPTDPKTPTAPDEADDGTVGGALQQGS